MPSVRSLLFALGVLPALSFVALPHLLAATPAAATAAPAATPAPGAAHLDSFVKADGVGYFALSVAPDVELPAPAGTDIVVLFDTSASQAGPFRDRGLAVLTAFLRDTAANVRVQLYGMDLKTVAMSDGFVSPQGAGMEKAIAALKNRAPLGASDLPLAFDTARLALTPKVLPAIESDEKPVDGKGVSKPGANQQNSEELAAVDPAGGDRLRAIVYIGDGQSVANFMTDDDFAAQAQRLRGDHIAVSSFAVDRGNAPFLAALANQTGGMLAIDAESLDAAVLGHQLATAAAGAVLWPTEVKWPAELAEVYPAKLPPLRLDRETVVVGRGKPRAELTIQATAAALGRSFPLIWKVRPGESNGDYAFLAQLVPKAKSDGGLNLPTVGREGLQEVARLLAADGEALARLSSQAIMTGNFTAAEQLADEALRHDPNDEIALAVKRKLAASRGSIAKPAVPAAAPAPVPPAAPGKPKLKMEKKATPATRPAAATR